MSPLLQKSVGRLELLARPGFAFRVQENGSLFKNSLRGEALTQWRKGGMAFLQVDWPYSNSLDQDDQLKILRGGIQQTWRWPQHGMTQLGIGYFRPRQYGLFSETMLPMKNDLAIFRLTQLGPEWSHWSQTRAVAEYRYRLPRLDLSVALSAGQFVDGDRGWILELGRYFGDVRIAPFVRDTSNGRLGGVWLSLPLSGQQNRSFQGPVRFRWGDWFDFKVDTNMERPNYFLDDVGNWIFTGRSVDRMFLNNDRLYPAYLREHVDRLKAAVAPWSQTN